MNKGDIFDYYNKGKKKHTALQLVDILPEKNQYIMLALYYWDDEPLTPDKVNDIKPFWRDHHSWAGEYEFRLCEGDMPDTYSFVANKEVLAYPEKELTTTCGWGYSTLQVSLQKAWEELPQSFRTNYKDKNANQTWKIWADTIAELTDGTELDKYPHLTKLDVENANSWVMDYINEHHNIMELTWKNSSETVFDFTKNRLTDLRTDGKGIEKIILNDYMDVIAFFGDVPANLTIVPTAKNRSFRLEVRNTKNLQVFQGLNINELHISGGGKEPIDMELITTYLPHLKELRIWGHPDFIKNMHKISLLHNLGWLTMNDVFGFTADEFPSPAELPSVNCIWMSSIPEDVAKKVKKEYKHIELWIRKGRKPDWLEANLNNPFRDWDGDEYIKPSYAKKASSLYANLYKQVTILIKDGTDAEKMREELESIIKVYADEFNKMDKRTNWIDTVIRENIWDALNLLLQPVAKSYGDAININALLDLFDNVRDF